MNKKSKIDLPLTLPCGVTLKNRIAKSAMSENMGTRKHHSNKNFENVYHRWAQGGASLVITGNVMCDSRHLGEARNIVIEKGNTGIDELKRWAQAGIIHGTHLWMQINHPGKQSPRFINKKPVSPSALALKPPLDKIFLKPKALIETEILEIIDRYTFTAKIAQEAGFTGVQIHGAHGYLVSQFLSPLHNIRTDKWGGSLENRMRFVVEIYKSMRQALGKNYPISIKLNSADFQNGGFTEEESMIVVKTLSELGMDLIEISGGTYEAPVMTGVTQDQKQSTKNREAYFLKYCERVREIVKTPIMLTGGFRTLKGMEEALQKNSCDVIGLARSLAINPELPHDLMLGKSIESSIKPLTTGFKKIDKIFPLEITWYTHQIQRMGKGLDPDSQMNPLSTVLHTIWSIGLQGLRRVRAK